MSTTGFVYHPRYVRHDTGRGHPERPQRLESIVGRLERSHLLRELDSLEPGPASVAQIVAVHGAGHVAEVERLCGAGAHALDAGDTAVCSESYEIALLAAGGALEAVDKVMAGEWENGFVACRPPGHHAEANAAMGFCLFNNVAVAAEHLRRAHGLERVAVLDWDVHHGNGTQHIFEADPGILYVSLHQYPWYPGTGARTERGRGDGEGATLNCPMSPGDGDPEYLQAFEADVLPAIEAFDPQFVLVSAGFDAHARDPLSMTQVTTDGFRRMSRLVADLAAARCGGRVVSLLEGGYDLDGLAESVQAHLEELRA
jgi:acetoin utilization deacetylase AcuC-like enzyme